MVQNAITVGCPFVREAVRMASARAYVRGAMNGRESEHGHSNYVTDNMRCEFYGQSYTEYICTVWIHILNYPQVLAILIVTSWMQICLQTVQGMGV